jgi:TonB family protein
MFRRNLFALLLFAGFVPIAGAQIDSWLEVSTPHFRVIGNSTEKDARRVALQFERMRTVFARVFPDRTIDTATPIVVLALRDRQSLQALEPAVYLANGQLRLVGLFLHASEKNYVLIELNAPGQHPYAAIYHEYAHFVQSRTGEWMPLWLTEGWAEFYQTAEILDTEVVVGKLDAGTWQFLERTPLLPIATLLSVDMHSPYYHEEDKGSIFYAESWALTHYIEMRDARDGTHRLQDYIDLVHTNLDPVAAAEKAFGELSQLQADLQKFIRAPDFQPIHIAGATDVDESGFDAHALSQTQADSIRADVMAYNQRETAAHVLLDNVLKDDPANVAARVTLGYIAARHLNYDEARKWYEQALKLDPQNLIANYYFAAVVLKKGLPDAALQTRVESCLRTAMRINPSFAPAYYGLGLLLTLQGKDYAEARRWLQKAIEMDPGNVEYRIDYANLLVRMNKNKDAADALQLAVKLAHTPEQSAAAENALQTLQQLDRELARVNHQGLVSAPNSPHSSNASGPGDADARGIYTPQPDYTEEAREARREGVCTLSLIVGLDGKTSNLVVVKKLGLGLDEKAVEAVRKWKFEPARKNGRPVLTHLTLSIQFKLIGTDRILELSEKVKTGDPAAELELANVFFAGKDIPKDDAKGAALLERAARDGLPEAQFQMAERAYGNGGNPETYVSAWVWYSLAQRNGFALSQGKPEIVAAEMTPEQLSEAQKQFEKFSAPAMK